MRCIEAVKKHFEIERWQVNQPINYSDIFNLLITTRGVQTVTNVQCMNVFDSTLGYSGIAYNILDATKSGIVYPSLDPMIFEVRFPDDNIKGRIANY